MTDERRGLVIVVGLIWLSALGGCRAHAEDGESDAVAASPSPRPSVDEAVLTERAKAARIPGDGLRPIGGPAGEPLDDEFTWDTWAYCRRVVADRDGTHVSVTRQWRGETRWYLNQVHGYSPASGAEVVAEIQGHGEECTDYEQRYVDSKKIPEVATTSVKYFGGHAVEIGPYPGIVATFGRCENARFDDGSTTIECTAFLARDNLVSFVRVNGGSTLGEGDEHLNAVAAIAAAALVAA